MKRKLTIIVILLLLVASSIYVVIDLGNSRNLTHQIIKSIASIDIKRDTRTDIFLSEYYPGNGENIPTAHYDKSDEQFKNLQELMFQISNKKPVYQKLESSEYYYSILINIEEETGNQYTLSVLIPSDKKGVYITNSNINTLPDNINYSYYDCNPDITNALFISK